MGGEGQRGGKGGKGSWIRAANWLRPALPRSVAIR